MELTLEETWQLCIKMWKWIVAEWEKLEERPVEEVEIWVNGKKSLWLESNGYGDVDIDSDCFFCEWVKKHTTDKIRNCVSDKLCPGCMVDKNFSCYKAGWDSDPPRFLKEIMRLDKIRKARMKKQPPRKQRITYVSDVILKAPEAKRS